MRFVGRLWPIQVQETELSRFAAEPMDGAIEHARRLPLDGKYAARDAARFRPRLDPQAVTAHRQRVLTLPQPHCVIAVFKQRWIPAGLQECSHCLEH